MHANDHCIDIPDIVHGTSIHAKNNGTAIYAIIHGIAINAYIHDIAIFAIIHAIAIHANNHGIAIHAHIHAVVVDLAGVNKINKYTCFVATDMARSWPKVFYTPLPHLQIWRSVP